MARHEPTREPNRRRHRRGPGHWPRHRVEIRRRGRGRRLRFAHAGKIRAGKWLTEVRALGRKAWALAVDVADAAAVERRRREDSDGAGPGGHSGQQRRRHARRFAHAHERGGLGRRAGHNLKGAFLFTKAFSRALAQTALRPHHQHLLGHRPDRQCRPVQLRGEQGRGLIGFTQVGGARIGRRAASRSTPSRRDSSRRT